MIFLVSNIRANNVNLIMNDMAAGLPSPLSFIGLADTISRKLGLEPWSARIIPILHSVTPSEGRLKPEMEKIGANLVNAPMMETFTGFVELSFMIDLPGCESKSDLKLALVGLHILGGMIQNHDFNVSAVTPDGTAFSKAARGVVFVPPTRAERLIITTGAQHSELSEVADVLFPIERPVGYGWVVPCAVGYRLMEDPRYVTPRENTRNPNLPHVFVEPVLGIAELVSIRNSTIRTLTADGLSSLFWKWCPSEQYVLGHPAYFANLTQNSEKI
jgi:hypothetical protein